MLKTFITSSKSSLNFFPRPAGNLSNLGFLGFFVRPITMKIVATSAIAIYVFSKLYKVTMWIYHKLPISSN